MAIHLYSSLIVEKTTHQFLGTKYVTLVYCPIPFTSSSLPPVPFFPFTCPVQIAHVSSRS
ncbi:hypothetical protein L798_05601 [Zootermopsis nevadensis]|uniref:Uncharacterized protein n=1 Tax=Zootermopsis nevadensis TaxID=136037 RepID=A0A067QEX1_ZOONE|nr:hypothetical protein L798_05601 [Zootermopsis nevadensis]